MFQFLKKFIFFLWVFAALAMLAYSFTQVDLSLTLSQVSIWQVIQKYFQQIGYFNRPLSTVLYISIIGLMFGLYFLSLHLIRKNLIERATLIKIVIAISAILFFSYNAFSYDLFNYIFDAKIITHYYENPYEHKALDYPEDPMLSFMHWTHRTYPYGPVWLGLTVPVSFIGLNYFLVTFYLFKLIMLASFIASVFLIEKIAKKMSINSLFAMSAFALNPLVLIEALVSAHNDIAMIALGLAGILFFLKRKLIKSFIFLLLSILLKYATVLLIPAIILKGKFEISKNMFFYVLIISMTIAVIFASYRTNFQPWYLLYILPFTSLVYHKYFISIPAILLSIAGLLQYVPYLYLGNWNPPVPNILNFIMLLSVFISLILIGVRVVLNLKRV